MSVRRALEAVIVFVISLVIGPLLPLSRDTSPSTTSLERENLAAATSFYAAANRFLEEGEDAPLLATLDSAFVDHSPLGLEPTTTGLLQYLASLRVAYPALRLEAKTIATRNDVVTISLATTPAISAFADGPVADWDPAVPGIEQLRIWNGKIAERWASGILPPQIEKVASIDLLQPAGWFVKCAMERLELEPGASMTRSDASPSLLIVSAGILSIEVDPDIEADLRVLMEQGAIVDSALKRGAVVELMSESVVLVPQAETYRIRNDRDDPLVVVRVEFGYFAPSTTFVSASVDQVESASGVVVSTQAGVLPAEIYAPQTSQLTLTQVNAAPKEKLPVHAVNGIEQVLVSGGSLEAEAFAGSVTVLPQDEAGSEALEGARELFSGGMLTAHSDSLLTYQVTDTGPAIIWFISVVPAPDSAK